MIGDGEIIRSRNIYRKGAIALVLAVLALVFKVISVFWAPAPVIAIIILAILHDGVLKRRERKYYLIDAAHPEP